MNKFDTYKKIGIIILCSIGIFLVCRDTIKLSEKKEAKPLNNMTYEEAVFYTRAFEDGYRTCLLETIKVAIDSNGDSVIIMKYLNDKAKETNE